MKRRGIFKKKKSAPKNTGGGLEPTPFAFEDDCLLATITEDETFVSESDVSASRKNTDRIAASAAREMREMADLLGKLEISSATRREKAQLEELKRKMSARKKELEKSKSETASMEIRMLHAETRLKAFELKTAAKEKEIRSVIRDVCAAERVDLCFIIDSTGSMASHIASVQSSIKRIVSQITKTNGNLKLRLSVVAYRDIADTNRHEVLQFTTSVPKFEEFVGKLQATGGDDAPEDIAGAVQKANRLSWEYPTRVVFLIADAPCHGTQFHGYGGIGDNYPSGSPGINMLSEIQQLSKLKTPDGTMTINFGKINSTTDQMVTAFSSHGVKIEVVELSDVSKVASSVTKGVRSSIFKTMSASGGGRKSVSFAPLEHIDSLLQGSSRSSDASISLKPYRIVGRTPTPTEWRREYAVQVQVYRNRSIASLQDLRAPLAVGMVQASPAHATDKTSVMTMYMRRAPHPFAEGEIRLAYYGQLSRSRDVLDKAESAMVMKSFKHVGPRLNDRTQYLKQMEVSNIAFFLANEYNRKVALRAGLGQVRFLQVCVAEEAATDKEESGNRRFCAEQLLPPGAFTKFSNNTGYWNEDHMDETLLRFCVFSYEITEGYLMLTDLQGVKDGQEFVLTDPAILCKDILRFGNTNLGEKVMKKCLDSTLAYMSEKGYA